MRHHWSPRLLSTLIVVLSALLAVPALRASRKPSIGIRTWSRPRLWRRKPIGWCWCTFGRRRCGPCMALNQNVFNQPGVANAIETQFVPVKLNADENSATATWYGITRVPTDVIVTPDGQMVAKLVSPPTPAAYVAEVTAAAGKFAAKSGQAYAKAAAAAPAPVAAQSGLCEFASVAERAACGRGATTAAGCGQRQRRQLRCAVEQAFCREPGSYGIGDSRGAR